GARARALALARGGGQPAGGPGRLLAPRLGAEALVIHDRDDQVVPWTQGASFARHWRGARLYSTDGLGHGRILQDESVVRAAADFIARRSAVARPAVTSLPQPAPLY
ncbi:MAG: alpha/beta fold hydrolase, partial [Betaproteobacteria bacterium]